jgi:hypothetical protein
MSSGPNVNVSGTCAVVKNQLTVTVAAYVAGNNVGGLQNIVGALRAPGAAAKLISLTVTDHSHQDPALDLIFFGAKPSATFTDHAAFPTLSAADTALILGRISLVAGDWAAIGGAGVATKTAVNLGVVESPNGSGLWLAINTSGTPTFVAASDLCITTAYQND